MEDMGGGVGSTVGCAGGVGGVARLGDVGDGRVGAELRLTLRAFLGRACAALQLKAKPAGLADCCRAPNTANLTGLASILQEVQVVATA